jgi:transcriptional regulator with GAF, ATPase, and Fis domain
MQDDDVDDIAETAIAVPPTHTLSVSLALHGAQVRVASGPAAGARVTVDDAALSVGSGGAVDLRIDDPKISRRHFELVPTADGLRLRDLGSRNGTWILGCRVTEGLLVGPTTIVAGSSTIEVTPAKSDIPIEVSQTTEFGEAVGTSVAMRHVFATLGKAAGSNVTVLLEGESGTGKEVLAQAVHLRSARAHKPFVVVDCASIPENLVESHLFGHQRGAFTGAVATQIGAFEQADGGTLFLDEVGDLPVSQQAKLLRVLESRTLQRVGGGGAPIRVDVRIVAATNVRLEQAVEQGRFRQDLFYRLSVVRVQVPPLRDRKEEIPVLAKRFYERFSGREGDLPPQVLAILVSHAWPGNVRELRNAVERFVALGQLTREQLVEPGVLPADASARLVSLPYHEAKRQALEAFDATYFPAVLDRAGGVVARAAELADVPRTSFHRMLSRVRGEGAGGSGGGAGGGPPGR